MSCAAVQLDLLDGRRKRRNRRVVALEHEEQAALFAWAQIAAHEHPALALLYHIPNGGFRFKATAAAMRRQGVRAGVPDICLPVARGGFHGLYLELKRFQRGVTLRASQRRWLAALAAEGYCVGVCRGWEAARAAILAYLAGDAESLSAALWAPAAPRHGSG